VPPRFRELVRYLHLSPLRAKLVADLGALDRYSWAGHATVIGRIPRPWQDEQMRRRVVWKTRGYGPSARFSKWWSKGTISILGYWLEVN
jgi:hypothetical protein